jgi:hypothetical protein
MLECTEPLVILVILVILVLKSSSGDRAGLMSGALWPAKLLA